MKEKISDILKVRSDVLEGKIVGVVRVENVYKPGTAEANPNWVFGRTCVLDDEVNFLTFLKRKLKREDPVGNILVIGDMGSGKSHLLLLAYHLFNQPREANGWLERIARSLENTETKFSIPEAARVVVIQVKEVEGAYEYLWDILFESTDRKDLIGKFVTHSPGMEEIREFLMEVEADKRPFVLILDEVEPWFNEISDQTIRERNRYFLEKLSEVANERDLNFILITALRAEFEEPKRTLSRECRIINLTANKRMKIIPYRLFEDERDKEAIKKIVRRYIDEYKHYASDYNLLYADENVVFDEMVESYPFHPLMLSVLFKKYTSHPSYQNTRGLLYLLSSVVRDLVSKRDLFLLSDVNVERYKDLVGMLDRRLIGKAITCVEDARRADIEYGVEIISALFYHSLVATEAGATELELLQSVFRPGMNPAEIIHSIHSVAETCTYVTPHNAKFLLGLENPESIVKKESARVPIDKALGEIVDVLNEIFGKSREVYLLEFPVEKVEKARELRIIFTLVREDADERMKARLEGYLCNKPYPNSIVFVVPGRGVDLSRDDELFALAKKAVAARDLSRQPSELKDEYERILREKRDGLISRLKGEEWAIVRWIKRDGEFDIRPLSIGAGRLDWYAMRQKLVDELWDKHSAKSIILERIAAEKQVSVSSIIEDFYSIRGYPLPFDVEQIYEVIKELCSNREIGVEQRGKQYFVTYLDKIDYDAKLLHPSLLQPNAVVVPQQVTDVMRRKTGEAPGATQTPSAKPRVEEALATHTLADTGEREVKINALVNQVEKTLLTFDSLDKIVLQDLEVTLVFQIQNFRRLSEDCQKFIDLSVKNVKTSLAISFTELKGGELIDWLKRAPDISARVLVRGKVARRT